MKIGKIQKRKTFYYSKKECFFSDSTSLAFGSSGMWWNKCLMKKENLKMYNHHCIAADFGIKTTEGPLESKYVLIYCFFYSGWPSPTEVVTPNVSVTFSQRRPKNPFPRFSVFTFILFNLCQTIYMNVVETLCLSLPALEECASSWNPIRERKSYIT